MDRLVDYQRSRKSAEVISNDFHASFNSNKEGTLSAIVKRDRNNFENEHKLSGNKKPKKRRKIEFKTNLYIKPINPKGNDILILSNLKW